MYINSEQTAILIFSRTASGEAAVKTFNGPAGTAGNTLIARHLIRQTVRTARSSGFPVFLHYDKLLPGQSFGERLADAMESVFEKGFSRVITIGNDSPELTKKILLHAGVQLTGHQPVLGPAADGGVYLIGLRKETYSREPFTRLPWQTDKLREAWQNSYSEPQDEPVWLEELHDIDHAGDFRALILRLRNDTPLLKSFISILASYTNQAVVRPVFVPAFTGLGAHSPLRGPPQPGTRLV